MHGGSSTMELNGDWDSVPLPGLPTVKVTELSPKYDSLFKTIISAGWANSSDGNVESPTGYFSYIEVPAHEGERAEMKDAVCDEDDTDLRKKFDELESGWYLTQENEHGLIWVYYYPHSPWIQDAYGHLYEAYSEWESVDD